MNRAAEKNASHSLEKVTSACYLSITIYKTLHYNVDYQHYINVCS